jgi:hypothetical protein
MSENLTDDVFVTHTMGGIREFQKTGIYPNKLIISSLKYDHVWRIKVTDEIQSGVLRIKRVVVYNYVFDEKGFRIQEVRDNVPISDWGEIGMTVMMND